MMKTLLVVVALLLCPVLSSSVDAVAALIERYYPSQSLNFSLSLLQSPTSGCATLAPPCFILSDDIPNNRISITASSTAELTAGLGIYLREYANQTIGWARGGGSNIFTPLTWPQVGAVPRIARRVVPYSWFMNVCTHSYTIVWYGWKEWELFLDWMALSGINMFYAYTGQEEMQYKVFTSLGVTDQETRAWFNGPAFLTWSRGQNSHGGSIAGPLPRSWMRSQWDLQIQILARARNLSMIPVLPGFQGNVPWPLAALLHDKNITFMNSTIANSTATGWMDALDPSFSTVGGLWMKTLIQDFGTDHFYAADGFFHDGTGWGDTRAKTDRLATAASALQASATTTTPCTWGLPTAGYLKGCPGGTAPCPSYPTLIAAQAACERLNDCTGGVTLEKGAYQLRSGRDIIFFANETSWLLLATEPPCHAIHPDPQWLARGKSTFNVMANADSAATWIWQGWALMVGDMTLSQLLGFALAPPTPQQFLVLDMSRYGGGQWRDYDNGSVPFIWTALHTFGGADSIKGNLSLINQIPFDAVSSGSSTPVLVSQPTGGPAVRGLGATPEGFDQNPAYYELIFGAAFHSAPLDNISEHLIDRAHVRYGLKEVSDAVTTAWEGLSDSLYSFDQGVSDPTAVGKMDARVDSLFWHAKITPSHLMCSVWSAWGSLITASVEVANSSAPYRYDLVNLGREVLAQLTNPLAVAFEAELSRNVLNASALQETGGAYIQLLLDLDSLLATEPAFLLGSWLALARSWGEEGVEDCDASILGPSATCAQFYEFNARVQLTTWYPVPVANASQVPPRDGDYARKHWSGLLQSYYAVRVETWMQLGVADAVAQRPLNRALGDAQEAQFAWEWQRRDTDIFPIVPVGDFVQISTMMRDKYTSKYFTSCK